MIRQHPAGEEEVKEIQVMLCSDANSASIRSLKVSACFNLGLTPWLDISHMFAMVANITIYLTTLAKFPTAVP